MGAQVVISDIDVSAMDSTCKEINVNGDEAIAIKCDVSNLDDVNNLIDSTVSHFVGLIYLLIMQDFYCLEVLKKQQMK